MSRPSIALILAAAASVAVAACSGGGGDPPPSATATSPTGTPAAAVETAAPSPTPGATAEPGVEGDGSSLADLREGSLGGGAGGAGDPTPRSGAAGTALDPSRPPDIDRTDHTAPIANLITLAPQPDGWTTRVDGVAGAVPGGSAVIVTGQDTTHSVFTRAASDGSFSASVLAPAGSHVQVKADSTGRVLRPATLEDTRAQEINVPPATSLRVPADESGDGFVIAGFQPFFPAGDAESAVPWRASGTTTGAVAPGGTWAVSGTVDLYLPESAVLRAPDSVHVFVGLERFFDGDGNAVWRDQNFMSLLLTPTGFPIERNGGVGPAAAATEVTGLRRVDDLTVTGTFTVEIEVPADLPPGTYRPEVSVSLDGAELHTPPIPSKVEVFSLTRPFGVGYLPPVTFGEPAGPRLVWTLLTDTLSEGTRGTVAIEDRDRFNISSKIIHQSERFIVPLVEPGDGTPVTYRLEPFVPQVGNADRGVAAAPTLDFKFPSGDLSVRVTAPDGSVTDLGSAAFMQSRSGSPSTTAGNFVDNGGGNLGDVYQLTTLSDRFAHMFTQYGRHEVTLDGFIEDVYGNRYEGSGTYEVFVARSLDLQTGVLPTTPFQVGDTFSPAVSVNPAVPAEVEIKTALHVRSSATDVRRRTISGTAGEFGYFHPGPAEPPIVMDAPGEYRADVNAEYLAPDGTLWMGSVSWGQVVADPGSPLVAHGRRGIDEEPGSTLAWFIRENTGIPVGPSHINLPYHSGDIAWETLDDAAQVRISVDDTDGEIEALALSRIEQAQSCVEGPPQGAPPHEIARARAAVSELPLFSVTESGLAPNFDDRYIQYGYFYGSAVRPGVSVRQFVSEDCTITSYWRFNELYALQTGVGMSGDLENDFKFQYGGVVFRDTAQDIAEYAIYGSTWVALSDDDAIGSRVLPPFRTLGGGGDTLMTLTLPDGTRQEIDMLIVPTGVRPGAILETGDTFSFSGSIAPAVAANVNVTVTSPSGIRRDISGRANSVGYFHDAGGDFTVNEPGAWRVHVSMDFDGQVSGGAAVAPFNLGHVPGTADDTFDVYVVPSGDGRFSTGLPEQGFVRGVQSLPVPLELSLPGTRVLYTITMPGWVLDSGVVTAEDGVALVTYDPARLAQRFPNIDLIARRDFIPGLADSVQVSFLVEEPGAGGATTVRAGHVTLNGADVLAFR